MNEIFYFEVRSISLDFKELVPILFICLPIATFCWENNLSTSASDEPIVVNRLATEVKRDHSKSNIPAFSHKSSILDPIIAYLPKLNSSLSVHIHLSKKSWYSPTKTHFLIRMHSKSQHSIQTQLTF